MKQIKLFGVLAIALTLGLAACNGGGSEPGNQSKGGDVSSAEGGESTKHKHDWANTSSQNQLLVQKMVKKNVLVKVVVKNKPKQSKPLTNGVNGKPLHLQHVQLPVLKSVLALSVTKLKQENSL